MDIAFGLGRFQAFIHTLDNLCNFQSLLRRKGRCKPYFQILYLLLGRTQRKFLRRSEKPFFCLQAAKRQIKPLQIIRKRRTIHRRRQRLLQFFFCIFFAHIGKQLLRQFHAHRTVQVTVKLNLWHIVCDKTIHHSFVSPFSGFNFLRYSQTHRIDQYILLHSHQIISHIEIPYNNFAFIESNLKAISHKPCFLSLLGYTIV